MYTVGVCIDEAYFVPALTTLTSLADSHPAGDLKTVGVRVLTADLSRGRAETMAAVVARLGFGSFDIAWHPTDRWQVVSCDHISATTYLRFAFTADFVGDDHLIYLDADLLVLGDVAAPLGSLRPTQVALVQDELVATVGRGGALPGVVDRWPEFRGRPYFNAGVMWCPTGLLSRLNRSVTGIMAAAGQHIHFNDQDALNLWALHEGAVVPAPPAYNCFELDRFEDGAQSRAREGTPVVLHFVGPDKPWQPTCPGTDGVRLYRSYLRQAASLVSRAKDPTAGMPWQ
ncbi:glycosyltransferase [Catellatospora citrea]|uniref:glycosyltransferase family 8 protein n=1 Tax=Catellatospora citrea TaxID=53366 RepID=UPI0033CF20BE